jgi:hypothetical protein
MVVQMVAVGSIMTDPMSYQMITGQPQPPEMTAMFAAQMQAQADAQGPNGKPKSNGGGESK